MLDATGQEMVVGAKYGYYTNKNGFTYVTIGTLKNVIESKEFITDKPKHKANLINREVREYMYNDGIFKPEFELSEKGTSVFCNILFRIHE